ncbi:hypothetical protein C8R44DRAFT_978801 [Mycena epipterygia]|nr:hypothetical protein C8R44DRAFT_978801 [Mycena epipterygia]
MSSDATLVDRIERYIFCGHIAGQNLAHLDLSAGSPGGNKYLALHAISALAERPDSLVRTPERTPEARELYHTKALEFVETWPGATSEQSMAIIHVCQMGTLMVSAELVGNPRVTQILVASNNIAMARIAAYIPPLSTHDLIPGSRFLHVDPDTKVSAVYVVHDRGHSFREGEWVELMWGENQVPKRFAVEDLDIVVESSVYIED